MTPLPFTTMTTTTTKGSQLYSPWSTTTPSFDYDLDFNQNNAHEMPTEG